MSPNAERVGSGRRIALCARAGHHPDRLSKSLYAHLQALGVAVRMIEDGLPGLEPGEEVWLTGSPTWFPRTCAALLAHGRGARPFTVLRVSEPTLPPRSASLRRPVPHLRELAKLALRDPRVSDPYSSERSLRRLAHHGIPDVLIVTSRDREARLAELGIASHVVPLGSSPAVGRDLERARDIDVLFLGSVVIPRRKRALRLLRRAGTDVVVRGGYGDEGVWDEDRVELLNRTKILLNIVRFPGAPTLWRLTVGMANGALVVSEPPVDPYPYVPGEHFVPATLPEMPSVVARYLADDEGRCRIALSGQRMVLEEVTEAIAVARMLELTG